MPKEIKILKSLYTKEAIMYTTNLYLEEYKYEICETETEFVIKIFEITDDTIIFFKKELNFNNLRFLIANENKDIRKTIIAKAL